MVGRATYRYESGQRSPHRRARIFDLAQENWGLTGSFVRRDAGNLTVPDVTKHLTVRARSPPTSRALMTNSTSPDFEQTNGMLKGGYRFGNAEATLRYERWDHEHNFLLPNGKGIGQELENNLVQAELDASLASDWDWKTSYTWNENIRRSNPGGRPLPLRDPAIDLERDSHTCAASSSAAEPRIGFPARSGWKAFTRIRNQKGRSGLTPGGQVYNLALFGLGRMAADPWTFEAGLRFDHRSQEADPSQTADDRPAGESGRSGNG